MINKISNKGIKQLIRISFMFDNFSKLTKAKLTTPIKVTIRVFRAIFNSSKSFFSLSNSAIFYLFANCIKNQFK